MEENESTQQPAPISSTEGRKLPTIADLYKDTAQAKELNDFHILVNQEPKPGWLREHPNITMKKWEGGVLKEVPYKYMPINITEWLLTMIFGDWKVEIKEVKLLANSVVTIIRLWYWHPVLKRWEWQDGVGAQPIQTDKDAGAINFDRMKTNSVMIGAPASESFAVKDAAEKIGKLFGKDIARKDEMGYAALLTKLDTKPLNA